MKREDNSNIKKYKEELITIVSRETIVISIKGSVFQLIMVETFQMSILL